jgi:hypothetical protein
LFGYEGTFDIEWKSMDAAAIPENAKPRREEPRE